MVIHDNDTVQHNDEESNQEQQEMIQNEQTPDVDYKTLYLRTNADFQNFKRRVEKERIEWTALMQASVIEKILPAIDDFERALQTAEQHKDAHTTAWFSGFSLILKNLKKTLNDLGVEEVPTTGVFNPELHEALMHVDNQQYQSGDIVQELSKGYTFKGKVIRHARVSVAK